MESLLTSALRLHDHKPSDFIAPVADATLNTLWVMQENVPYQFGVGTTLPGWYQFHPTTKHTAYPIRDAYPYEYLPYLDVLPNFYVVTLFRLGELTWLCSPMNAADATQRGWPRGQPRQLHLVRDQVQPLELVCASALGNTLLYREPAPMEKFAEVHQALMEYRECLAEPLLAAFLPNNDLFAAYKVVYARGRDAAERIAKRQAEAVHAAQLSTTEGRMRYFLEFAGAELEGWRKINEGYEVVWSFEGHEYHMRVKRDMYIDLAGICLANTDGNYDLATIVGVMQEARHQGRFDLDMDDGFAWAEEARRIHGDR